MYDVMAILELEQELFLHHFLLVVQFACHMYIITCIMFDVLAILGLEEKELSYSVAQWLFNLFVTNIIPGYTK